MALASSLPDVDLAAGTPHADGIGARLERARQAVEKRFLDAGEVLSQAVGGVGELVASLDRLTQSLDSETMARTAAELTAAASDLGALPAAHAGRRERIEGLARIGDALGGCIEEMRQHLAYLRVFAINIKITSGGIAAAGPEFAIFAQEICDCIEEGRAQLEAFSESLAGLGGALKAALGHEERLGEQCAVLLPDVPDALMASVAEIAAHHERLSGLAASVRELARDVQKKVGRALGALQIGDITRQRIEHVQAGLDIAARADDGLDADRRRRKAAFLHGLLAAQLAATAEDFRREIAAIGQNMAGIAEDAAEILRLREAAEGRGDRGGDGFLRALEANVGRAHGLVGGMDAAERTAETVGRSAASAAQELTASIAAIQTFRADVQMMALNTTLKCSRIGETGRPLDVIAVELRRHAGHLEKSADLTLTTLEALSAEAARLGRSDGEAAGAAAGALDGAASRIREAGDAVEADLVAVADLGSAVVEALKRASSGLDFRREIGALLDEALDRLTDLSGAAATRTDDLAEALEPALAEFARLYTMAQERDVHRQATAGLALAPARAATPADLEAELDEVLF